MTRPTQGIRLLPNAVTVLALCAGLSTIEFALAGHYRLAIAAVAAAALLDGLDGRLARLLDATSKMGAELDSLSDAVSFGVAPALAVYVWALRDYRIGWVVTLLFVVCMLLRLARFNTLLGEVDAAPRARGFFVGVPAPAGGLLVTLPLALSIQLGEGWWSSRVAVLAWTVLVAVLVVSRIPTVSVKTVRVSQPAIAPLLVLVGLFAAVAVSFPMWALVAALMAYLGHIPYAGYRYRSLAGHSAAWTFPRVPRRPAVGLAAQRTNDSVLTAVRRVSGYRLVRHGPRPPGKRGIRRIRLRRSERPSR
jgi:CDP-diacylglycerol--serine O-phosphatidyltransferase